MIKDNINNHKKYNSIANSIKEGLEFLANTEFTSLEDGKHILSDNMYVNIQTYYTKANADYEAHRDYADIQYIIEGSEKIGVTDYKNCTTTIPYDKERDIEFLSGEDEYHHISEGEFMILYPEDAHKPSLSIDITSPQKVRKAVVKVRI